MMLQQRLNPGQFLLKEHNNNLLHVSPHHHHLPQHAAHHHHAHNIYSAYAYQQQQLIGSINPAAILPHQQSPHNDAHPEEVLDLSRNCESAEIVRKTPSPYQTSSSQTTESPHTSPSSSSHQQSSALARSSSAPANIPTNLLYSSPMLYPAALYYSKLKQEPVSTSSSTTPPPTLPELPPPQPSNVPAISPVTAPLAVAATSSLLQSFAAAVAAPLSPLSPTPSAMPSVTHTPTSSTTTATVPLDAKSTRPFKAFPRDPVVIAANFAATDVLYDNPHVERYTEYRKRVLEQIHGSNGGTRTVCNPKMRRTNSRSSNLSENDERHCTAEESSDCDSNAGHFDKMSTSITSTSAHKNNGEQQSESTVKMINGQVKDAAYYERRRKNNAAAKKSRDRRRIKEDEIAIRAAYLERQNIELLCQVEALKAQLAAFTSKVGA